MSENDAVLSASQTFTSQSQSFLSQSQSVLTQSQRVNKLSRRGRRAHKKEPDPPQSVDLNTSDDFTTGFARCRSKLDSSSRIPEPERPSSECPDDLAPPCSPLSQCEGPNAAAEAQAGGNIKPAVSNISVYPAETSGQAELAVRSGPTSSVQRPPQWKVAEVVGPSSPTRKTTVESTSSNTVESVAAAASPVPPTSSTDAQQTSVVPAVTSGRASPPAGVVLDCPVCLQPLASASTRAAHLRLCAERRGLSQAQLLAAVRLQERQTLERRAAGLPAVRTGPAKRTGAAARTRRRAAALPAAQDPDLQMALAVSASLQEEEQRRRCAAEQLLLEAGLEDEVVEQRRSLPEPPPPPPPPAAVGRRAGRRRAAPVACELQRQTAEERQRRLCEKVAQLLAWEEEVPAPRRPLPPRRRPAGPAPLWTRAAQTDTDPEAFYVPELAGRVQRCAAPVDALLRDVAQIPGRWSLTQQPPASEGSDSEAEQTGDYPADSTQAALMMLAEESAGEAAPAGDSDGGCGAVRETSAAAPDASLGRRVEDGVGAGREQAGTSSWRPVSPDIFDDSGSEDLSSALPCPLEAADTEETQLAQRQGRRDSLEAVSSPLLDGGTDSKTGGSRLTGPGEVPSSPELTAGNCGDERKPSASADSPARTVVSDSDSAEDDSRDATDSSVPQLQMGAQLRTAVVVCERITPQSKTMLGDGAGAERKRPKPRKSQVPQSQISPGGRAVVETKRERHPGTYEGNITEVRGNGVDEAAEISEEDREMKDSLGAMGSLGRLNGASDLNESVTLGRRSTRLKIKRETYTAREQELNFTANEREDERINCSKQNSFTKAGRQRGRAPKHPVGSTFIKSVKEKQLPKTKAPTFESKWKREGIVRTYSKHNPSSVGTVGAANGTASGVTPEARTACSDALSYEPVSEPEGGEQQSARPGLELTRREVIIPPYSEPHAAPPGVCFRSEGGGGLGEALLQQLRDRRHSLPPGVALLPCRAGFVAVHECVLQARCPELYAALPTRSRISLLGSARVSQQAVAALVEFMYLDHVRCHDGAPYLCELLMLATRFGCVELADHVRQMHCGSGVYSSVALSRLNTAPRRHRALWEGRHGDGEQELRAPGVSGELGGLNGQQSWNEDIPGYAPIRVGVAWSDVGTPPARGVACDASPRSSRSVSSKHAGGEVEAAPMSPDLDIKPSDLSLLEHSPDVEDTVIPEPVPEFVDTKREFAAVTTASAAREDGASCETVSPTRSSPLRSTSASRRTAADSTPDRDAGLSEPKYVVNNSSLSAGLHKSPVKKVGNESPTGQQDQPDVSSSFTPRSSCVHPAEISSSPRASVSHVSGSAGAGRQQRPPSSPAGGLKRSNAVLERDLAADRGVLASPRRKRPRAGRGRGEEATEPSAGSPASSRDGVGGSVEVPGAGVGCESKSNNSPVCDSVEVKSPTKRQRETPVRDADDSCDQEYHPAGSDGKVASSQLRKDVSARAGSHRATGAGSPSPRPPSADSDVQILDEEPEVFSQRAAAGRRSAPSAAPTAAAVEGPSPPPSPLSQITDGDCPGPADVDRGETTGSPVGGRDLSRRTGKASSKVGEQRFDLSVVVEEESDGVGVGSPESKGRPLADLSKTDQSPTCLSEASDSGPRHQRRETCQVVSLSGDEGGSEDRPEGVGVFPGSGDHSVDAAGADDVWEGFDDGGYIELLDPTDVSPVHLSKIAEPRGTVRSQGEPDRGTVLVGPGPVSEPPQASSSVAGTDDSFLWPDDSLLAACHTPAAEKHGPARSAENAPTQPRAEHPSTTPVTSGAGQTPEASTGRAAAADTPVNPYRVVLRESHTPRPNYVLMLTPELKEQLARIGVKPIPRRKAVALLSHIYEETHPPAEGAPPPAGRPANTAAAPPDGEPAPPRKKARRKPRSKAGASDNQPPPEPALEPEPVSVCSSAAGDAADSDAESSSSDGAASRMEQLFQRLSSEEDDDDVTPSQAATAADLPGLVTSFIRARPDLHRQVLTYEPIWIERLLADLKLNGVKVKLRQLTDVLDEQCVTFRTEKTRCRQRKSPKKRRSPKKAAASKRPATQKKASPVKPS